MSTTMTKRAAKYWTVAATFLMWNQKRKIRNFIKNSSLGVISISTVVLIVHVVAELSGGKAISGLIEKYDVVGYVAFFVASLCLVIFNYEEAKKPEFEYAFVLRIWEFMENRRYPVGSTFPVRDVLGVFHRIFEPAGVARASIYRISEEGVLTIDPNEVFPAQADIGDYIELKRGEGVAGRVCEDMKARYMPRMTLLKGAFPHAINFEWNSQASSGQGHPIELSDLDFELDVFKEPASGRLQYKSFLSVPLKSVRKGKCMGVLNLDFSKLDPLDKTDIAMAMVIGLILADEV